MKNKTPNTEKSINSAFDSVALINKLVAEIPDDKKKSTVARNVKHLELMLTKEFFKDALTSKQQTELENCIAAGNTYTA